MPDEQNNNQGVNSNDAAATAAADKAAADAAATAAAAAKAGAQGEETVTIKKSDLKKIEDDRDNYRTGLLQKKADERDLRGSQSGSNESGGGSGQGNSTTIDEKKVGEVATATTIKVLRDAAEKVAKREFLRDHPEYVDDAQWTSLMSNLTFKGGEVAKEEIKDRMEAALFEHKRSTGRLEEHLKMEHDRGVREGRIQEEFGLGLSSGGAGDKNNDSGKSSGSYSTPKGEEMAQRMHVDPEKGKKVDLSKDNVINVL